MLARYSEWTHPSAICWQLTLADTLADLNVVFSLNQYYGSLLRALYICATT